MDILTVRPEDQVGDSAIAASYGFYDSSYVHKGIDCVKEDIFISSIFACDTANADAYLRLTWNFKAWLLVVIHLNKDVLNFKKL